MQTNPDSKTTPRLERPVSVVTPRAMREQDAASYVAMSSSYLRNTRLADMRRLAKGQAISGPRWVNIGAAVRYLREDLDAWIDSFRIDPGHADPDDGGTQ